MYQPDAIPELLPVALAAVRCPCGWSGPATGPAEPWLVAGHFACHEPAALAQIAHEKAFELSLVFARGRGCASVVAPELTYDLAIAGAVLRTAGGGALADHLVPCALLEEVIATALFAAAVLGDAVPRPEVADELVEAADDLSDFLDETQGDAAELAVHVAHAPRIRPAAPPEVGESLRAALAVASTPVLLLVAPEVRSVGQVDGRDVASLVHELTGVARELQGLERILQAKLTWLELSLRPLPVVAESTLDELANDLLELQLAKLRVNHLGELLLQCADDALGTWARATSGALGARVEQLAGHLSLLVELLDRAC